MKDLAAKGDWAALGLDAPDPASIAAAPPEPQSPFSPATMSDFLQT